MCSTNIIIITIIAAVFAIIAVGRYYAAWLKFSKHSRALDLDRTNERTAEENWLQPASQAKNAIVYVFESIIALLLLLAGCSPARPSSCVSVDHHSTNKLSTHALVVGPRGRCECMNSAIYMDDEGELY